MVVTFDGRNKVDGEKRKSCFKMQTIGLGLQQTQSKIIGSKYKKLHINYIVAGYLLYYIINKHEIKPTTIDWKQPFQIATID